MAKHYTKTKVINGKEYKAQFNGISAALEAIDNSYVDGTGNTSMQKLSKYILENVIVEPKNLTPDDFDSIDEFSDVISFGREVMEGKFRDTKDSYTEKEKGGK